jgi:replication factor C subunit 2/4
MCNNYCWVEKYRPINLSEIISQNNIINSLKSTLITKNIPHFIFYGPSGCGKTSTIIALANELFNDNINNRIIELNASDERGINIIREKIKKYAKLSINNKDDCPQWKIIILDEADSMTPDSQFALRRIMEQYSKITRFCIICNYYNKIIDPIISRCALFKFKSVDPDDIINKLNYICGKENFNCPTNIINKIINYSSGDLRKAINLLQKFHTNNNEILLDEISGIIPNSIFINLMDNVVKKNIEEVNSIINNLFINGYSLINQIMLFHNYILYLNIDDDKKSNILYKLVEIDQYLINGCDEYIQFMKFIYFIIINI